MPEDIYERGIYGICGSSGRPCQLVWTSKLPNKIGTYPSELLPSRRTIWHASTASGYYYAPALTGLGDSGTGIGMADMFGGFGIFGSDIQIDIFTPKTKVSVIFARTENRINIPRVITEAEFKTINFETGILEIDLGEYVFEAVAVTLDKSIVQKLYDQAVKDVNDGKNETKDILGRTESKDDQIFRRIVTLGVPTDKNLLKGIVPNKRGTEYRLDNNSPQTNSIFTLYNRTVIPSPLYRDGSSRKISINLLKSITKEQENNPYLKESDVYYTSGTIIYLTYVAVKEHYIRQSITVSWSFVARSLPQECYPMSIHTQASNYRFYEWTIKNSDPKKPPIILGGWRVVETFNVPVNVAGLLSPMDDSTLGMFAYNNFLRYANLNYFPPEMTEQDLDGYITNRATIPEYVMFILSLFDNHYYYKWGKDDYKKTGWYDNRGSTNNVRYSYDEVIHHTMYNIHRKALQKRDIDKFGIERFLAQSIETDVKAGRSTFFPFLDDVNVTDPFTTFEFGNPSLLDEGELLKYLDDTNTKFDPIKPISQAWLAEMQCFSVGGSVLFPNPFVGTGAKVTYRGDVITFFFIESPLISESFAKDTRILAEQHFTVGQQDIQVLAIEGASTGIQGLTCIGDPSYFYGFVVHSELSLMNINMFSNQYIIDGLNRLEYRPDYPTPIISGNNNPSVLDYSDYVGFSGMLGDKYGYYPGRIMSVSGYAPKEQFSWKSSAKDKLSEIINIDISQIDDLTWSVSNGVLIVQANNGYYGEIIIEMQYTGDVVKSLLRFKIGESLVGCVDEIDIKPSKYMFINTRWMFGNTIELTNIPSDMDIKNVSLAQLKDDFANDILNENRMSTFKEVSQTITERLENRSVFVKSEIMSMGEDYNSRLFVFFNDNYQGISCLQSDNFGTSWYYHFGIVEPIANYTCLNPFIIQNMDRNIAHIIYQYMGTKLMCKKISYDSFTSQDAMIIERFEDTISQTDTGQTSQQQSKYTPSGQYLRRDIMSYIVAGDLTDEEFLKLTGRDIEGNTFDPFERRIINDDTDNPTEVLKRTYSITVGSTTAFTNKDVSDVYFSGYRTNEGGLKVFFMGSTSGSTNELQCRFSNNDGLDWYDLWEYIEYGLKRLKTDPKKHTSFIDRDKSYPDTSSGDDPQHSNQDSQFGINLHWSRMRRDKKEGQDPLNVESESNVMPISSPYVFYHPILKVIFIFYVYNGCLLCKRIEEKVFDDASTRGMSYLKDQIEKKIKAEFIDGDLSDEALKEELLGYEKSYSPSSDPNSSVTRIEVITDGNIIMPLQINLGVFNNDRRVNAQRVCAYNMNNGHVRVFYKNSHGILRAGYWNGTMWVQEDLHRDLKKFPPFETKSYEGIEIVNVSGGFGEETF